MIKSICFDLGDGRELYLTLEEVAKLSQAFRHILLDNKVVPSVKTAYNPPPPISDPFPHPNMYKITGFEKSLHGE